jgi:hypothetical protein
MRAMSTKGLIEVKLLDFRKEVTDDESGPPRPMTAPRHFDRADRVPPITTQ